MKGSEINWLYTIKMCNKRHDLDDKKTPQKQYVSPDVREALFAYLNEFYESTDPYMVSNSYLVIEISCGERVVVTGKGSIDEVVSTEDEDLLQK